MSTSRLINNLARTNYRNFGEIYIISSGCVGVLTGMYSVNNHITKTQPIFTKYSEQKQVNIENINNIINCFGKGFMIGTVGTLIFVPVIGFYTLTSPIWLPSVLYINYKKESCE